MNDHVILHWAASYKRYCTACKMALYRLLALALLLFVHGAVGDQVEISLNGDSWTLSDTDGKVKAIKAQVPGTVHLDLM